MIRYKKYQNKNEKNVTTFNSGTPVPYARRR